MSTAKTMSAEEGAAWRIQLDGMLAVLRGDLRPEAAELAEHLAAAQLVAAGVEANGPSLASRPARKGVSFVKPKLLADTH